ncbi:hypothetical protein Ccrd_013893 [Cynara cardunculus var. scolymus]|uniref:Uncharacterized protein n=1 Tax=Cynara cardunculus var. scolymus TaxID=59895 RepID=A0A103YER6_CYNCS|nr:hypothetical protein Ccrd_013893 [Cynara cardunculus var. scolymus]
MDLLRRYARPSPLYYTSSSARRFKTSSPRIRQSPNRPTANLHSPDSVLVFLFPAGSHSGAPSSVFPFPNRCSLSVIESYS